jgi:hypothetical protein
VEGTYAKFQPESFYGSNNESFVMDFSYYYGGSETTVKDAVIVDGQDVSALITLATIADGKGGYDFSKLDLTNTAVFKDGADGSYLVTIGGETRLVGDKTLKKWAGTWETWQDYIHPDEAKLEQYPRLEEVWGFAYDAYIAAFTGTALEETIKTQMPDVEALKNYWNGMTDTKGVSSLKVENKDSGYVLSWIGTEGTLYSGAYTMIGKMANGLERATMYIFEADEPANPASYKYLVTMEPDYEGDTTHPIAAHYHFQFGDALDDLLNNGPTYNGTDSNIKDTKWYATMINSTASVWAKYNVILAMHRADKWSEVKEETYSQATLDVDYAGTNNAVFFDFSTGTATELPHDFFDIAIDASSNIIANSGSYGSGVQVYMTTESNIAADFSTSPGATAIKEYTFKTGESLYDYQTVANPLGSLASLGNPGTASKVALVKVQYKTTDTAEYFKVVFSMTMGAQSQSYNMTVVPGLGSGETNKVEIKAAITGITNGYGWLYFKLVGEGGPRVLNNGTTWTGSGTAAPQAANWDILATRTNELQSTDGTTVSTQMPVAGRSSVLLNTYKTVKAKVVTGKPIDQVTGTDLSDDGLSGEIDAIGYSWYTTAGIPPSYSVSKNIYVIKTAEGGFAKFQPKTFAKDGKSFVMDFDYSYKSGE